MKLLKVIIVIFLIYFIRRFIQMYKTLRLLQAERESPRSEDKKSDHIVDAEYKVID